MGDSAPRSAGYLAGRVHFYRDRGAGYVDGLRTSFQAGVLVAGVAFGAKFTASAEAIWLGASVTVGLELLKILGGWIDWRWRVIHTQNIAVGFETSPVAQWQILLLEEIALNGGASPEWVAANRHRLQLDGRVKVPV